MTGTTSGVVRHAAHGPLWCCSYCAAPLEVQAHGLYCSAEERWFATLDGIHRLLPEERRREMQAFLELYQRVRRDEGFKVEPELPEVPRGHPHHALWQVRGRHFRRGLELAAEYLGAGPWRVLDVGAGCCWASARLIEQGHDVVAVDVNLDPEDGLRAAAGLGVDLGRLARAEAEMDALPLEPGAFDLVLAAGALHYSPNVGRTLVELRRVTRRGGALLVLDSPTFRSRPDGEAMVARRMRDHARRYEVILPRESQSGYLVLEELPGLFERAGWNLTVHGWPGAIRERLRDVIEVLRHGRRTARFPIFLARRDG